MWPSCSCTPASPPNWRSTPRCTTCPSAARKTVFDWFAQVQVPFSPGTHFVYVEVPQSFHLRAFRLVLARLVTRRRAQNGQEHESAIHRTEVASDTDNGATLRRTAIVRLVITDKDDDAWESLFRSKQSVCHCSFVVPCAASTALPTPRKKLSDAVT